MSNVIKLKTKAQIERQARLKIMAHDMQEAIWEKKFNALKSLSIVSLVQIRSFRERHVKWLASYD